MDSPDDSEVFDSSALQARQNAVTFLEKYDRFDCQELLAECTTNWLLSSDNFTSNQKPPLGLIQNMPMLENLMAVVLLPCDNSLETLFDYREIHQVLRELTVGIYACNQIPGISLDVNYDLSSTCTLPPAYIDTKVGQLLTEVDYHMKSLWHGVYFPKEKRIKFSERWKSSLDLNQRGQPETKKNILQEFIDAGVEDITKIECFKNIYDTDETVDEEIDRKLKEEMLYFMSKVDHISMNLTLYHRSAHYIDHYFFIDTDWTIGSSIRLADNQLDQNQYELLNSRLQRQVKVLQSSMELDINYKRMIALLRLCAYLVPALIGLRKRMQIPILDELLPPLVGDEIRTERELPPMISAPNSKCKHFSFPPSQYFHLHGGIQIDLETPPLIPKARPTAGQEDWFTRLKKFSDAIDRIASSRGPPQENYPVQMLEINDVKYIVLPIRFERFYPQPPRSPLWVRSLMEEQVRQRNKKLPMADNQLHEQFKKHYGLKGAIKNKNAAVGLKTVTMRGLVAMFLSLMRKVNQSDVLKQDEQGYSLIHLASLRNRVYMVGALLLQGQDPNVRRVNTVLSTGPTALHLASRTGSLHTVSCLIAHGANVNVADNSGWAPIHHAAFFDHQHVIRLFVKQFHELLELRTKNEFQHTPLLLAASSGALSSVKELIKLGALLTHQDRQSNGVAHLAAMRLHTNILEHFIAEDYPQVKVWNVLVEMLKSPDINKRLSSVRCLEVLSVSKENHWQCILKAGGVSALVELLESIDCNLQFLSVSVLCNISYRDEVRICISNLSQAAPLLIKLLHPIMKEDMDVKTFIHLPARAAVVLSDLAFLPENRHLFASLGAIPALVKLLHSTHEAVLVNSVNALRMLCTDNLENQNLVAESDLAVNRLVEFLTTPAEVLQAASSSAIAALVKENRVNQDLLINCGSVRPLVDLIKGRGNIKVQVEAATAVENLAHENPESQEAFLNLEAEKALIKLLKIWSVKVKEQAAMSLKALAGDTMVQQKFIAQQIGISLLIELIMTKSENLQYCGCLSLIALSRENIVNQNSIAKELGIQPMVRLLKTARNTNLVLKTAIRTLGSMCLGIAFSNNPHTQKLIAAEDALELLSNLYKDVKCPPDIRIEVACTLGYLVLANKANQQLLKENTDFDCQRLLNMLSEAPRPLVLRCCMALTIFAFNNTVQQYSIRQHGGIPYKTLSNFLESEDEYERCHAAFQIVVLARDIIGKDQVTLTALGVTTLVQHLRSNDDNVIVLTGDYLASLAHTRAGIPDAMVTTGAVEALQAHLFSSSEMVRRACAVALGYLTFNSTASRMLLKACRETPNLFDFLMENLRHDGYESRINPQFVDSFERARNIGLPCMYLEINGGPSVHNSPSRNSGLYDPSSFGAQSRAMSRAKSAPLRIRRPITAASYAASPTKSMTHSFHLGKPNNPLTGSTLAGDSNVQMISGQKGYSTRCKTAYGQRYRENNGH